jgi:hypothetical protein
MSSSTTAFGAIPVVQRIRHAANGATSLPPGAPDGGVPAGRVVLSLAVGVIGTVLPLLSEDLRAKINSALATSTAGADRQWLHYILMLVILVALLATPGLSDCLVRTVASAGTLYLWLVALAKCRPPYMGGAVGLLLAGMVAGRYVMRPHLVPHRLRKTLTPDVVQVVERGLYAAAALVTIIGLALAIEQRSVAGFSGALAFFFDVVPPAAGDKQPTSFGAESTLTTAPTVTPPLSFGNY